MKIPVGDFNWFDLWFGIVLIVVIGQTSSCVIELQKINSIKQENGCNQMNPETMKEGG